MNKSSVKVTNEEVGIFCCADKSLDGGPAPLFPCYSGRRAFIHFIRGLWSTTVMFSLLIYANINGSFI